VLCGGAIGMALLSGHHQNPMYALLALTGVFSYLMFRRLRRSPREAANFAGLYLATAVTAFILAGLLHAVRGVPGFRGRSFPRMGGVCRW
jgi:hypothetical protein